MNPYYGSGWSSSFSFAYGNSYNYGMNTGMGMMGMGYGCPYGNPYNNSWASWGMSYGMGLGYRGANYGTGYYGYSPTIIVNDNRSYAYGKRGTQNGMVTSRQSVVNARSNNAGTGSSADVGSRPIYNGSAGGRMAANSTISAPTRGTVQPDYYNRNWRTARQGDNGGSGSYSQPTRSNQGAWDNNSSQSQWNRSSGVDSGRSNNSGYNGGNGSGATRTAAPASSGSGGRTRGRD